MKITHGKDFNPYPQKPLITLDELKAIAVDGKPERIEAFYEPLLKTLAYYNIDTPLRICHFLAQILHESGSLKYTEEIASGEAYEGRKDLGNVVAGDGVRYKGRGLIQLTGRANYEAYQTERGFPVLSTPELIATDFNVAADVSGWFWDRRNLNLFADADNLSAITKRVNGGLTGFQDRKRHLDKAKSVLIGTVN